MTDTGGQDLEPAGRADGATAEPAPPGRLRRAAAAASHARDRTVAAVVAVLVPLIRATRLPLAVVALYPAGMAIVLLGVALARPGVDDWFWGVVAAAGLVAAVWLEVRRRQLQAVARDPDRLATELGAVLSGRHVREQVLANLGGPARTSAPSGSPPGPAPARRRGRPLRVLRGMWRGVQLTGIVDELLRRPEIEPLLPGRLRGIGLLVVACLVLGTALGVAVLMAGLIWLLGG